VLYPLSRHPASSLYDAYSFAGAFLNQADVALNAWILAWDTHALASGNLSGLFDANIFYPAHSALAYSEHLLGAVPLFAPFYLLSGNLALSLNLWIFCTFVLSGLAAYWVSLRWFQSHLAASVAAVAYAFAPWRLHELTHVQLLSVQYLPLVAYMVWETRRRRDRLIWVFIFGLTTIQALSSYYLGYMVFLVSGIIAVAAVITNRGARARQVFFIGSALGMAALAMVPVSLPYLETAPTDAARVAERALGFFDTHSSLKFFGNYLFPGFPTHQSSTWGAWRVLPWVSLLGIGVGVATTRYRALTIALSAMALLGACLALGPIGSLFSVRVGMLHHLASDLVPGWSSLRAWNRFGIVTWFAVSFLASLPFARGVRWLSSFPKAVLVFGVLVGSGAVLSAVQVPIRIRPSPEVVRDLGPYRWLAKHGEGDPVLNWPLRLRQAINSEYMYLSTLHWLPLLNGYSGHQPASYELIESLTGALPGQEAVDTIAGLNVVRWLVVHTQGLRPGDLQRWDQLGGPVPLLRHEGPRFRIYEFPYDEQAPTDTTFGARPGFSVFGTPLDALREKDLEAEFAFPEQQIVVRLPFWRVVPIRIRNLSSVPWPGVGGERDGLVGVIFRIRQPHQPEYVSPPVFSRLLVDLAPGQATTVNAGLLIPRSSGLYEVIPCLTQAGRGVTRCAKTLPIRLLVERPKKATQ
jgi:hypothetical protein